MFNVTRVFGRKKYPALNPLKQRIFCFMDIYFCQKRVGYEMLLRPLFRFAGETEALKILYEEYRFIVYSVALSILRNKLAAEDVLQETFIRVYERAVTYQPGTNPKAWVVSIARNLAFDALRREKKHITNEFKEIHSTTDLTVLQRLELTEALFRLEEIERQIVVMHLVAGFKHYEISKELGIPPGTVRWKYRQSLLRLAEYIGGDKDGAETLDFRAKR